MTIRNTSDKSKTRYRFFTDSYASDTTDLSVMEHGVYHLLLDAYYYAVAENGGLSADRERLYRICRATTLEEKAAVDFVVPRFFRVDGEHLAHKKDWREFARRGRGAR